MNSNFFGCSTGRSTGLAPFKILSIIRRGATVQVGKAHAVGHKPAVFHIILGSSISPVSRFFAARSAISVR